METLPRLLSILCATVVLLQPYPAGAQQRDITGIVKGPGEVTLTWEGSHAPYLVQTSPNLLDWCDQGEIGHGTNAILAAEQSAAFYRVRHLNPTDELGDFYGLIQTEQGESGAILGRHRLKSRWWFYKPQGLLSNLPAAFFQELFVFYQHMENEGVTTWTGRLESLGDVAMPGNADIMTVSWTNGTGTNEQRFTLTLDFPYNVNTARVTEPLPSDPYYQLECVYSAPQPELDLYEMKMATTTTDQVSLVQLAPPGDPPPPSRNYSVVARKMTVTHTYLEGLPLYQGSPPWYFWTFILDHWTAPTTVSGGGLPNFGTDSYFALTLLPWHHNFCESVLVEPARDLALSEAVREALRAANVQYLYTFKDFAIGINPDDIRIIGFDNTIRVP